MSIFRPCRPTIREISTAIFQPATKPLHKHVHPIQSCRPNHPRTLHTTSPLSRPSYKPKPQPIIAKAIASKDRGPRSSETTQTDFDSLNILNNIPVPSTSIDACAWDGFHLNSGVKITEGNGVLLVAGEAFTWAPWLAKDSEGGKESYRLLNEKGQWEVEDESWGILGLVWPKPG